MKYLSKYYPVLVLIIAGLWIWRGYFGIDFMNEDFLVILWQDPKSFIDCFASFAVPYGYYYRPVIHTGYALTNHFAGFTPFVYHLQNILIHLLSGIALYYLILRIRKIKILALGGALLFLSLSSHIPAVAWIAGRTDAMLTFLLLLSFIALYRSAFKPPYYLGYIWAGVFFLAAILSKELAYAGAGLPALLLVFSKEKRIFKVAGLSIISAAGIIGLTLFIRHFMGSNPFTSQNFDGGLSLGKIIFNFAGYAGLGFMSPEQLEVTVSQIQSKVFPDTGIFLIGLGVLFLAMLFAFIRAKSENRKLFLFGLGWYLIMIAPGLTVMYRWYVFGASVGLVIMLISLIDFNRTNLGRFVPSLIITLLLAIGFVRGIAEIHSESKNWKACGELCREILDNSKDIEHDDITAVRLWGCPDKYRRVNLLKTAPGMALMHAWGVRDIEFASDIRSEIKSKGFSGEFEIQKTGMNEYTIKADSTYFFERGTRSSVFGYDNTKVQIGNYPVEIINDTDSCKASLKIRNFKQSPDTLELFFNGNGFEKFPESTIPKKLWQ
jgi:hypothetical protein